MRPDGRLSKRVTLDGEERMARKLTCWLGMAASGGNARLFGGKRLLTVALACILGLCLALPAMAAPGDRYTKDKAKGATTQPAPTPAPVAKAASQPAEPASDDPAPSFSKAAAGPWPLGSTTLRSPADFDECVRVALAQSPLLTKSAIEIESKRLDVGDAYSQYIPTIVMSTTFYLRLPEYKNTAASTAARPGQPLQRPDPEPLQYHQRIQCGLCRQRGQPQPQEIRSELFHRGLEPAVDRL